MKKAKFVLVFLSLILFTASYSQSVSVGVQGMYNIVGVVDPNTYGLLAGDYKSKYGDEFGISGTLKFNKRIGIQLEINTSQQGYSNTTSTNSAYNRNVDLNYVQVPVLFRFNTGGAIVRFYALGGIQFGFLNGAKYNLDSVSTSNVSKTIASDLNVSNRYNSSDFSVVLGTGIEVSFLPMLWANLGLRGNYGLTDINASAYKNSNGNSSNNYWGGIELGLHYKIL